MPRADDRPQWAASRRLLRRIPVGLTVPVATAIVLSSLVVITTTALSFERPDTWWSAWVNDLHPGLGLRSRATIEAVTPGIEAALGRGERAVASYEALSEIFQIDLGSCAPVRQREEPAGELGCLVRLTQGHSSSHRGGGQQILAEQARDLLVTLKFCLDRSKSATAASRGACVRDAADAAVAHLRIEERDQVWLELSILARRVLRDAWHYGKRSREQRRQEVVTLEHNIAAIEPDLKRVEERLALFDRFTAMFQQHGYKPHGITGVVNARVIDQLRAMVKDELQACAAQTPPGGFGSLRMPITVYTSGRLRIALQGQRTSFYSCLGSRLNGKYVNNYEVDATVEYELSMEGIDAIAVEQLQKLVQESATRQGAKSLFDSFSGELRAVRRADDQERDRIENQLRALKRDLDRVKTYLEGGEEGSDEYVAASDELFSHWLREAVRTTIHVASLDEARRLIADEEHLARRFAASIAAREGMIQTVRSAVTLLIVFSGSALVFLLIVILNRQRLAKEFEIPVDTSILLEMFRDERLGLARLSAVSRFAKVTGRGDLLLFTDAFIQALEAGEPTPESLAGILALPADDTTLRNIDGIQRVFRFYQQALEVRSSGRLIRLRDEIQELGDSLDIAAFTGLSSFIDELAVVAENVERCQRAPPSAGAAFLTAASGELNAVAEMATRVVSGGEQRLVLRMIRLWNSVLQHGLEELQGVAECGVVFPSLHLPFASSTVLEIELRNRGTGYAAAVICELITAELQPDEPQRQFGALLPDTAVKVPFKIHPPGLGSFDVCVRLTFDDIRRHHEVVDYVETITIREGPERPFVKLKRNPFVVGAPIRDSAMFVGRESVISEVLETMSASSQTNAVIIYGQRRTGKTSLLYELSSRLPPEEYIPALMDAQAMQPPTTDRFYHLMLSTILAGLAERGLTLEIPDLERFAAHPDATFEKELARVGIAMAEAGWRERRVVVMIDEFEYLQSLVRGGSVDAGVFAYLRHLVQHESRLAFILAGTHVIEELASDYWSDLFGLGVHIRLGFLSEPETRELLMRPTREYFDFDNAALDRVYDLTHGQPLLVQSLASRVVLYRNRQRLTRLTRDQIDELATEYLARGPAQIRTYWEESSVLQRLILVALTTLHRQRGEARFGDLKRRLEEYGIDTGNLTAELESLVRREILLFDHRESIEIPMALLIEWISRNQSLERLVA